MIYIEGIRDSEASVLDRYYGDIVPQQYQLIAQHCKNMFYGSVAHEIAHGPGQMGAGSDHAEGGILTDGPDGGDIRLNFRPASIKRFRDSAEW